MNRDSLGEKVIAVTLQPLLIQLYRITAFVIAFLAAAGKPFLIGNAFEALENAHEVHASTTRASRARRSAFDDKLAGATARASRKSVDYPQTD
jgi:hypothetical protein